MEKEVEREMEREREGGGYDSAEKKHSRKIKKR